MSVNSGLFKSAQKTSASASPVFRCRAAALDERGEDRELVGARPAGQCRQVERLDPARRVEVGRLGDGTQRVAELEAGRRRGDLAVHERQRLEDRGLRLDRPLVAAGEELEEAGLGRAVAVEAAPAAAAPVAGRAGKALEELARREAADRHRGEQVRRARLAPADRAGQAIGPRRGQSADQELQVVAVHPELAGQLIEQLGMSRGILLPHVIDGLDQPGAEEAGPDAVDRGAREVTDSRGR